MLMLTLALLLGLPYYWLLLDNRPDGIQPMPIHMAQLRELAASKPGPLPESVRMELVAHRLLPGNLVAAGSGMKRRNMGMLAFVLPVPGGRNVLIGPATAIGPDAGISLHRRYRDAAARVEQLRRDGAMAIATDGGAGASQPAALAPGVVAIPAPSHRPSTRMIYARIANGAEYLFATDVAPLAVSWKSQRGRARLVSDWLVPEDRRSVFAWLRTIRALKLEAPALHVVPGYDYEWLRDPQHKSGVM
ncbi:MAG: hypothetical protein AB7F98_14875 [Novosphingobium sp.]